MQAIVIGMPLALANHLYIPETGHTGWVPILSGIGTPGI